MLGHVFANAVAKNVFSQKTLDHADESLPFAISNIVERAVGLGFVRDRLLDGMRG